MPSLLVNTNLPTTSPLNANTVICVGDSIMRAQGTAYDMCSFVEYAAAASQGAMKLIGNKGVIADTTAKILLRLQTDIAPSTARWVMIMEATNDALQSVPTATHRTNMIAIITAIFAMGKIPIIVAAPPCNGYNTTQYSLSDQQLAVACNIPYLNPWLSVAANGNYIDTTWSLDGVHPTTKAARVVGTILWNMVASLFNGSPDLTWTNNDPNGMLSNGLFLTNTANVPTGWTTAAGVTNAIVAGTGDVVGNWWQQTLTAQTAWQVSSYSGIAAPANWLVGDTVRMSCRIKTTGFEANGGSGNAGYASQGNLGVKLTMTWGGTSATIGIREICGDVNGVFTVDGIIPVGFTGTSSLSLVMKPEASFSASGVASIAQLNIFNLSLLSRA